MTWAIGIIGYLALLALILIWNHGAHKGGRS